MSRCFMSFFILCNNYILITYKSQYLLRIFIAKCYTIIYLLCILFLCILYNEYFCASAGKLTNFENIVILFIFENGGYNMAISEAQKKASKKWDQENMKSGSFKMYIDLFNEFEQFCKDNNISKNKVINEAVKEYIENKKNESV